MSCPHRTLNVDLGARSYPIHIGAGLLDDGGLIRSRLRSDQVMVVTNETVAPLYLSRLRRSLEGLQLAETVLPDGEQYKTLADLGAVFDALLRARFNRNCVLVALGGGVVGDMTGFAAACYQRGVDFIQVPTTLLAQVDSSVGGKTGVNHPLGKNMIGAFHQPRCVIIDTDTLSTLDDRQLAAGLAEVIKYGLIGDAELFQWLDGHMERLRRRDPAALAWAIERSCADKAAVVAADETEAGQRALLNLGHTFGHAVETGVGYGAWLHGEAVAVGMCMAADLSRRLGWLAEQDVERITRLIARAGLPLYPPAKLSSKRFLELMAFDKKVIEGRLRLVLLQAIGKAVVADRFDAAALRDTLTHWPRAEGDR